MKEIINMNQSIKWLCLPMILCLISCISETNTPKKTPAKAKVTASIESKEGKKLFMKNCALCHNMNMVDDMTGPALYGVAGRWSKKVDLIHFIQNPQELINNNHERAVKIAALWPSEMTAFPQLDSLAIEEILAFVEEKGAKNN
jgi:mono/diheme cytochrome c family protein